VWKQLARDPDQKVRTAVVRSRWSKPNVLRLMTGDPNPEIVRLAQHRVLAEPAND
jgi:hypothetical protein